MALFSGRQFNRRNWKPSNRQRSIVGRVESLEARQLLAGDLIAQWVADDLESNVEDGQVVASWTDSISGKDAAMVAGGSPTLIHDALSGRGVIRFDAESGIDVLRVEPTDSPLDGAADFSVTVAFVTSSNDNVGGNAEWYENSGLVSASRLGFGKDWGVTLNAAGQASGGIGTGFLQPKTSVYSTETGLNDGNLHFLTFTRAAGTVSLFVDGGPATTQTGGDTAPRDQIEINIGAATSDSLPFYGDIAEVRLYNGALDAGEVAEVHSQLEGFYVNEAPTANDDSFSFDEDPLFGFHIIPAATGVLANDTDLEGDPLSAVMVDGVANGTVTLNADGGFTYDPPNDFFGTDSFTYQAVDGQPSSIATVTITVNNVYDRAVAVSDSYKTLPGTDLSVDAANGLFANDTNLDRVDLKAVLAEDVGNGNLTLNEDGSFLYNSGGFAGVTSFKYQAFDGTNNSAAQTVTLIVNTPPVANDDGLTTDEDQELSLSDAVGVIQNDVDAEGDALTVTIISEPTNGIINRGNNGALTYVPNANFFGSDSFTYQLSDGEDASEIATANLTINSVNDAPVAVSDVFVALTSNQIAIDASKGVLRNDTDVENDPLIATLQQGPTNGTLELDPSGSFVYTANEGFQGVDSFRYTASDQAAASSQATEALIYVGFSPVVISEFMVANVETVETRLRDDPTESFRGEAMTPDWIEIHNPTDAPFDLGGYHLTDNRNNLTKWAFPAGTIVDANDRIVVYASRSSIDNPELDETGRLHTNFKLQPEGEYLGLTSPGGVVMHDFGSSYPRQRPDVSYGLDAENKATYFKTSTLGAANSDSTYLGIANDTSFSVDRGYYSEPFTVEITTTEEGGAIWYTLDGSTPSPENGTLYADPIAISTTTNLRAAVFKADFLPSLPDSQTYLFLEDVLQQSGEGIESAPWGDNGPDWEMDPEIVNSEDPEIRATVDDLKSIPTVSLTTDWDSFFGNQGIYPWDPASGIGVARDDYEIPTSFEFFDVDGRSTQAYSTVQIVGGSSPDRNGNDWKTDKLSMRVKFTENVGRSELNYPVLGAEATDRFTTLVVDARLNNVWSYSGGSEPTNQRGRAQYLRDSFASDLQLALGGAGAHGHHVHVYINGVYWGLHTLHERPDDNFAATYLGGDNDDYDIIKHSQNEVITGSNETFQELTSTLGRRRGPDITDEQYETAESLLEIDDFINYMLLNFYGANADWDHHNWYASHNRVDGKWRFHSWDAEKMINGNSISAASALAADRTGTVNANSPTGIHDRLMTHPEYKIRFSDAVQKHFRNGGVLSPEGASKIYNTRAATIDGAIRAESARWGDNQRSNPYTRRDWVDVKDDINAVYFPARSEAVIAQFVRRDWLQEAAAPVYSVNGNPQHGGFAEAGSSLSLAAEAGTVFYTLDGTDPRVIGGDVSATAMEYSSQLTINGRTQIKSRLRTADGIWSALSEAHFITAMPADSSSLRISEIQYHPGAPNATEIAAGFDDAEEFEFIEVVNISNRPIDLTAVSFRPVAVEDSIEGVSFDFSGSSILELGPGQRALVVENVDAMVARYGAGLPIAGQWSGRLSNRSEPIKLVAGDETIHSFAYDDDWHPTTDGTGRTLQVVNASSADLTLWERSEGWRPSSQEGGSPGSADDQVVAGDSNGDGVFDSSDLVVVFTAGEYEDDIPGNSTFEEGDWNGDGDFTTADLVFAFTAGTYVNAAHQLIDVAGAIQSQATTDKQIDSRNEVELAVPPNPKLAANLAERRSRDLIFDQIAKSEFPEFDPLEAWEAEE